MERLAKELSRRTPPSSASAEPDSVPRAALRAAPRATIATVGNATRLMAVDTAAADAGLEPGLTLADARARVPALDAVEADPDGDRRALEALAEWTGRYTPLVALDAPGGTSGLVLDITGCAHLFGGEQALLADLTGRLEGRGLTVQAAVADTPAAARAVARTASGTIVPPGGNARAVAGLPVATLDAEPETVSMLERLGLKRIGQLVDMPPSTLAARFGSGLLTRLDRALGRADEPLSPLRPPPVFVVERVFAEPIRLVEDIERVARALGEGLAEPLSRHGQGARRLALTLFRIDNKAFRIAVGLSRASRDPARLAGLLIERLGTFDQDLDTGEGIERVRLAAEAVEPLQAAQTTAGDLAGESRAEDAEALARLADRLTARLGHTRVVRLVRHESHIPELAVTARPAVAGVAAGAAMWPQRAAHCDPGPERGPGRAPERPLRLLDRPEPIEAIAEVPDGPPVRFRWRRVLRAVARIEGPERIAPEWWAPKLFNGEAEALTRDYFRVEDEEGRRYWVYRAGLYDRETVTPRWYLHGLFG
ncbi:Y-family DNA polymerase [Microbaculum sp. FT89]|uniref:Y-family DNA polymerase n=1 Tax=Microbaculum sp. FT89 TaxID=3447298 RepID=UPI003F534554